MLLPFFIGLELLVAGLLLNVPQNAPYVINIKHTIGRVLGEESDQPPPEQTTSEPAPSNTTSQPAAETPPPTNETPPLPSQPPDTVAPAPLNETSPSPTTEIPSGGTTIINPTDTPQETPTTLELSQTNEGHNTQTNLSITSPDDIVASPEKISDQATSQAQKEDQQLDATSPNELVTKLTDFAKDKVIDIDASLKIDDFPTVSFLTQRLNGQLSLVVDALDTVPDKNRNQVKQTLQKFCKQADFLLRNQELVVPETLEQDIEMARGTCLDIGL